MNVWLPALRVGSGTDTFTERLAAGLRRQGVGVRLQWFPASWEYRPRWRPATPPADCDLLHANSWHAELFGGDLPRISTVHLCVHDPLAARFRSAAQSLYHRTWIRCREVRALRRSLAVTAVSHYTRTATLRTFGSVLEARSTTIHNWVDTGLFAPASTPRRAGRFRLLFVGNPSARKGFNLLPTLLERLGDGFELLYTAGRASGARPSRLPGNMLAVPRIDREPAMAELYQRCDALLFPSRLEGFGYAALEAQACGLPVVAFASSSIPEIVVDGETGLLAAADDLAGLEWRCRALRDDPALYRRLSAAARQRAVSAFAEPTLVARYLAVYEAVLSGRAIPHD